MRVPAVCFFLAATVSAAPLTALKFTNPVSFATGFEGSIGWQFRVGDAPIRVVSLGLFEEQSLASPPLPVGLFDLGGHLLASALVNDSDPLRDRFHYKSIAPLVLAANTSYRIAGLIFSTAGNYAFNVTALAAGDGIAYQGPYGKSGPVLTFPSVKLDSENGLFGPNFEYESVVPEPPVPWMAAPGALAVLVLSRRRIGA